MKTAGIIVEYNPFHNGHKFHIEETRKATGADFIIAVMSGNFVQRGACALLDKYTRTQMALSCGADLVLELPVLFATGSAGDFASGAVSLLDKLGVVDAICFGSECGDIDMLQRAAAILAEEPPKFSFELQLGLKQGSSFPNARASALKACLSAGCANPCAPAASRSFTMAYDPAAGNDFLLSPNNILGIEYCTALRKRNSPVRAYTIRREGAGYLEDTLLSVSSGKNCGQQTLPPAQDRVNDNSGFASALSLRRALRPEGGCPASWSEISPFLPPELSALWQTLLSENSFLFPEDFSRELRYRLILEASAGFEQYADVSRELSHKLKKSALLFDDWNGLCAMLKSRETTYSRISRSLCHILLSVTRDELDAARQNDYVPYVRILGFQKKAAPLLSAIKKNCSIPIVSKLADARRLLPPSALSMLQKDIQSAHLYEAVSFSKTGRMPVNEYTRQIILI